MTLEELRDAWRPGKPENGRIQEKIWDERAEDFEIKELPSAENNEFLRYLYEKARPGLGACSASGYRLRRRNVIPSAAPAKGP